MSSTTELVAIVGDAQKQTIAAVKEVAALSGRVFQTNLDLTERIFAYQRGALEHFADTARKTK